MPKCLFVLSIKAVDIFTRLLAALVGSAKCIDIEKRNIINIVSIKITIIIRDVIARHSGLTLTYGSSGSGWRELGPPQVIIVIIIIVLIIIIIIIIVIILEGDTDFSY